MSMFFVTYNVSGKGYISAVCAFDHSEATRKVVESVAKCRQADKVELVSIKKAVGCDMLTKEFDYTM